MRNIVRGIKLGAILLVPVFATSECLWGLCHAIPGPSLLCGIFV